MTVMTVPNSALLPPGISGPAPLPGTVPTKPVAGTGGPTSPSFSELLAHRTNGVQFSNHALQRIGRRGIEVDPATLQRLDDGVGRAAAKGAREAVVLVDQSAFVVSVRNKTVITAIGREHLRDHVFTNIDSAVIA